MSMNFNTKKHKIIQATFFIFIFLLCLPKIYSNEIAKIRSVEFPGENIIYFGPLLDNQSTVLKFSLTNLSPNNPLVMYNKAPTFIITNSPNSSGDDFFNFKIFHPNSFPILLNEYKPSDTLQIEFTTKIQADFGRKEAMLILGLTNADDSLTTVICDTFYLIGKKTNLFVDGYDNIVNFDSVFINQKNPPKLEWKVKNTTDFEIDAISQSYKLISQNLGINEFEVEEKKFPLKFYPGNNFVYRSWLFSYNPLDLLADTALVSLVFNPDPNNLNKTDTASVKICGIGVQHSLDIKNANCDFIIANPDTVDFGYVRINEKKTINVTLTNKGNINYGLKTQQILDEIADAPVSYFEIQKKFLEEKNNDKELEIGDSSSFEINFVPDRKGAFLARYIIENDFATRKIRSSSIEDYRKIIILRGIGVTPTLDFKSDTVNFGNISYANSSQNCLTTKDTIIHIFNSGNATLIISDIHSDNNLFTVSKSDLSIKPNSFETLQITFEATYPEKTTTANLIFTTNEIGNDTKKITLIGTSIPPIEANLFIPNDLKNKPGSILAVPIKIENKEHNDIFKYIKTFEINLVYNPNLLEFINITKLGTSSESCRIETKSEDGALEIKSLDNFNEFIKSDTLILINFKTFLGNQPSTEIAIQNAKIGNGNCDDFMKLNVSNGKYSIDSICGLEYKLQREKGRFSFVAENDNSELYIKFAIPYEINSKLSIFNIFGEEILSNTYIAKSGVFNKKISLERFTSGIYFVNLTSGIFNKTIPIFITK